MKLFFICILILAAAFFAGCTTNPETGAQELFGFVPVESVVDTVEPIANEAKTSGGVLGIAGTLVASAIALWRRRKELAEKSNAEKAKAVAGSVIDGVDAILKKIEETKASGGEWAPSKEELLALLKAKQVSAGTRADVDEILADKKAAT